MYYCKGFDYGEKVDLSKGNWNPKRKMWVIKHFSEIIIANHDIKKALKYRECMVISFQISEKCVATPNFLFGLRQPLLRSAFSTY